MYQSVGLAVIARIDLALSDRSHDHAQAGALDGSSLSVLAVLIGEVQDHVGLE